MKQPPVILTIAGSDPSGGAGVQADIKTISALGGFAAAAITAITVQNTQKVMNVKYLSHILITDQIKAVLSDFNVSAVKIGMTGQYDITKNIGCIFLKLKNIPIVFDPVMVSGTGFKLANEKAINAMQLFLLPICRLATPNLFEASILLNEKVETFDDMKHAAMALWQKHHCAFLIKGGHLDGNEMVDVLFDGQFHYFTAPRINTRNLHGTGCTLSSAIATYLGMGFELPEAITQAKGYLNRALEAGADLHIGHGNGPLWHSVDYSPL